MSLGWCTESTILPKKKRFIHGVSASSMVGLRAMMYKAQMNGSSTQNVPKTSKSMKEVLKKNKGVEERDAVDESEHARQNDVASNLSRKAALYDELQQTSSSSQDNEQYLVDFDDKKFSESLFSSKIYSAVKETTNESKKRSWETTSMEEDFEEERRRRVRALLADVCEETANARAYVLSLREKNRQRDAKRVEMLKARLELKKRAAVQVVVPDISNNIPLVPEQVSDDDNDADENEQDEIVEGWDAKTFVLKAMSMQTSS